MIHGRRDLTWLSWVAVRREMVDVERLSDPDGCGEHREVEVGFSEVVGWGDDDGDGLDGVEGMRAHPVGL